MFIGVKDKDRFIVGYSIRDVSVNMDERDLLLEDNYPVWKVRGNKGALIVCSELDFASTMLKYNKKLFDFDICDENIFGGFISKLKSFLDQFDLIEDSVHWNNQMLIIKEDCAYLISDVFSIEKVVDYCSSNQWMDLVTGSLARSADVTVEKKIVDSYELIDKMRAKNMFPIALYDSKTGKRKVVRKYSC